VTEKKPKASFSDQLKLNTPQLCAAAIKNGWIATLISLSITLVFSVIGIFTHSENTSLNYFLDPSLLFDVVLMAVLAFFIYKKSRIAATMMFLYFVISKLIQWHDLGNVQGLPMALVFMFFYFNAMRGTFIWHAQFKQQATQLPVEAEN
jgi:ABC-type proline/glycine betaine transport system permease subunit